MLPAERSDFGSCAMKIENRKAEPPEAARGRIVRTYLYMEGAYKRYSMSKSQRQLMSAWDKMCNEIELSQSLAVPFEQTECNVYS
jgi:deoxyribonuclease-1